MFQHGQHDINQPETYLVLTVRWIHLYVLVMLENWAKYMTKWRMTKHASMIKYCLYQESLGLMAYV